MIVVCSVFCVRAPWQVPNWFAQVDRTVFGEGAAKAPRLDCSSRVAWALGSEFRAAYRLSLETGFGVLLLSTVGCELCNCRVS